MKVRLHFGSRAQPTSAARSGSITLRCGNGAVPYGLRGFCRLPAYPFPRCIPHAAHHSPPYYGSAAAPEKVTALLPRKFPRGPSRGLPYNPVRTQARTSRMNLFSALRLVWLRLRLRCVADSAYPIARRRTVSLLRTGSCLCPRRSCRPDLPDSYDWSTRQGDLLAHFRFGGLNTGTPKTGSWGLNFRQATPLQAPQGIGDWA
jgi:hypothetical protein